METATIIGLDLAKRSFQAHGAPADGRVAFRKKLTREKVLGFLAEQPRCVVAMEAAGAPTTGVGLSAAPGMKFA
jgi:transposase